MMRAAALLVLVLGTGLGLGFGVSASANSAVGRHAGRSAAAVVLLGSQSRPIFRVRGRSMHVPRARPGGSPSGRRLCRLRISGNAGHDYGDRMYVVVANRRGKRLYGAGRYHPKSNELDCIGLIVLSHSRRQITFTFGHAYMQYSYPRLRNGQRVKVVVGSMTRRIVARYRG
jgi:hypothetical protein